MSDITVTFKNQTILTMDASGSKPLLTGGKYCEGDITIAYVKPSGGGSSDLDPFPIPSGYSLPANYQKLLYCESSGAQICDSGVHPTLNTKIEIAGYLIPGTYGAYKYLFGCNNPSIYVAAGNYNAAYWGFGNKSDFSTIRNTLSGIPIYSLSAQEARIENAPFSDVSTSCGATSLPDTDPDTTIGIMGRFTGRTPDRQAPARFYRMRIWESETLIRCIFPVLKDGTEVCLYDVINGIYMPNRGTGSLVGGMSL